MNDSKTIMLCADDFGLNPGICQGILKLVYKNRLSAVSCMVNQPDFKHHAKELAALKGQVHIGMHFNLTQGTFLSPPYNQGYGLKELLIKTHLGFINPLIIAREFQAQLDEFKRLMGFVPDFIDGHQHVHQFPGIRQVVLQQYQTHLQQQGTYIRSTYPATSLKSYQFKARILAWTGGRALQAMLNAFKIPHNVHFSGIYDFAKDSNYRSLFCQWLALVPTNTLIMCHPGEGIHNEDDIGPARFIELNYFLSDDFLKDCEVYKSVLSTGPKA
ncbi:MAG: ChbG/HpnK family deacetylase [Legionellales bacterium]